jgi:hypothetical protein
MFCFRACAAVLAAWALSGCSAPQLPQRVSTPRPAVSQPAAPPSPTRRLDELIDNIGDDAPSARPNRTGWRTNCRINQARAQITCTAAQTARSGETLVFVFQDGFIALVVEGRNTAGSMLTRPFVRIDRGQSYSLEDSASNNWIRHSNLAAREMLRGEIVYSSRTDWPHRRELVGEYTTAGLRDALKALRTAYVAMLPQR